LPKVKTGGRKKGTPNAKTKTLAKLMEGKTPLEFLLETMRDETKELFIRLDCSKAAAPYVHSRKAQQLEVSGKEGGPISLKWVE
jgi:hypothetical protein